MKSILAGHNDNRVKSFCEGAWQVFVLVLLAFSLLCFATEVRAAEIKFTPNVLTVTAAPGETVAVPIKVSLEEAALPNAFASFGIAWVDGSLNRNWINGQVNMSLNSWFKTRQAVLQVKIPADAKGGVYRGVLKTIWLRSNENVPPAELELNVAVDSFVGCSQVPLFSNIVASQQSISMRNNKQTSVALSGSVSALEGCNIDNVQYQLTDEYGELDTVADVLVDEDGRFAVDVPVIASRKGNDKDGRLYTIKFVAEDEAGVGESVETNIVVAHDNSQK